MKGWPWKTTLGSAAVIVAFLLCGSAVFGVFLRRRAARRAAAWARRLYPLAEVVDPLQSPDPGV